MARALVFDCPVVVDSPSESAAPGAGTKINSKNWSGNQDYVHHYDEAYATWTVPHVAITKDGENAYSVIWAGLGSGADSSHELVQAGTKQYAFPTSALYDFWYQITPGQSLQTLTSPGINYGNQVYLDVWYSGTQATFFLENNSTGHYTRLNETFNSNTGQVAEWIVERPKINGSLPDLAFWSGAINITGARAFDHHDGTFVCAGVQSHYYDYMYYTPSTPSGLLAYPGGWTDTNYCNFPVYRSGTP